jgi:acetyl/propionyl-CoA carboxylase alpha subunit/acetyl-CoA carboxylase carboxyltransferase component
MKKLLVANRGEIAVRILRAASDAGIRAVAVYADDEVEAMHVRRAPEAYGLSGSGAAPYLDIAQMIAAAAETGCDAIHPGYGFLSENPAFARACAQAGVTFVGPTVETLEILGDKVRARALAQRCGVPVLPASAGPVTLEEAEAFLAGLGKSGAVVVKAVAGGGGRGMRVARSVAELRTAYPRCQSEARAAFGNGDVYVEELFGRARHVEVQILGDGAGGIVQLGERECSIQRRHQKIVELAPCPSLSPRVRTRLAADALRMAHEVGYRSAGTFEFLVDADASPSGDGSYAFIEANPRLQVEHTITEEILGIDLVRAQLAIADGATLHDLQLAQDQVASPRGHALQLRVNTEVMTADGGARPTGGAITALSLPSGPGVRVDTAAYGGMHTHPGFDSLLLKLVVHSTGTFADAVARAARALSELEIEGLATNVPFLKRLVASPRFLANRIDTTFVEENAADLVRADEDTAISTVDPAAPAPHAPRAGAKVDRDDPLAVLAYGKDASSPLGAGRGRPVESAGVATAPVAHDVDVPDGTIAVRAPLQGTIVAVEVAMGDAVREGQALLVMSAMKMEHVVQAPLSGIVERLVVDENDTVPAGAVLVVLAPADVAAEATREVVARDPDHIRPDLAEVLARHAVKHDASRPDAVARRRKTGQRTARENVDDLCDPGTFVEYGSFVIAAQRTRRPVDELIARTPADGLVAGLGRVNGELFDEARTQCAVLAYDYTVLAGTQGMQNHKKKDRLFEVAERLRVPVVFFTEGGGGRPGDTDVQGVAGLDCMAFHLFAKLSGLVPLVGINSGRCFAGNAALLGCCDVVIAAANSNIGMGGPAMIEGGGLGVFRPEEVGPMSVQVQNGVVDVAVADEAEGVRVAKQYLSYFQGRLSRWDVADQRALRHVIPENRLRVYEVRDVIETIADAGSVLELRRGFGPGMVTALARIEGRPLGIVANDPKHLAGAIDSPGADKAARFLQLCDAYDLPVLFLCDTPGIMVGPEIEKTALVRHCSRLFVVGASLTVPTATIVLRKSYGLGAQAMAGGSHKAPLFTVSWPTGEFGGMGLEGAVKLGFRKELEAIAEAKERKRVFDDMVARAYERGKATNTASHFEIDEVIDPAESRARVAGAFTSWPGPAWPRAGKKRGCIDTW